MKIKDKVILIISPQPWDGLFVSKHHYAIELARRGNTVYFLNPPKLQNEKIIVEKTSYANLYCVSYRTWLPLKLRFHFEYIYSQLMKIEVNKIVNYLNCRIDILWCFDPNLYLNLNWFKATFNIYHPVDFLKSRMQYDIGKSAHVIFSVASNILDSLDGIETPKYFINHGLSNVFGKQKLENAKNTKLKFAYIGNLLILGLDIITLTELVRTHPSISFSFYGPYESYKSSSQSIIRFIEFLKEAPNVTLYGKVSPDKLKEQISQYDGFLICYNLNLDLNQSFNSHKILEYLSAGKVIVSNKIKMYEEEDIIEMCVHDDNSDYMDKFDDVVRNIEEYNSKEKQDQRRKYAFDNTYDKQIDRIEKLISLIMKFKNVRDVLFITTTSLATNPRLVKNIIYFKSKGYNCKVLAFVYGDWSDKLSEDIIKKYEIDCQLISVSRSPLFLWIEAAIVERLARFLNQLMSTEFLTAVASNKRSYLLWRAIRKLDFKIDFIEAHTLAALYPARFLSKIKQSPFMFDIEDFHPEELIQKNRVQEKQRRIRILKSHLPEAEIVTAASPLIAFHLEQLLDWKKGTVKVLNNSFYANEFIEPKLIQEGKKVKFVWFSQTISFGRGLELFIEAAHMFSDKIELVLIGKIDKQFSDTYINSTNHFIQVVSPMSQLDLHKELSNYDIGLAIEQSSADFNKEICLSNKLFAYLQAGLFLFATNTKGQTDFLKDQKNHCLLVNQNIKSFAKSIEIIIQSITVIRLDKENRFSASEKMCYKNEISKIEKQLVNFI